MLTTGSKNIEEKKKRGFDFFPEKQPTSIKKSYFSIIQIIFKVTEFYEN